MNYPLRFGIFLAPFHPSGQNPTAALHRDVELIQLLDRLGYDEVWIGEHHSSGFEIIASPEVFIAHAAARTERIRFGTGVVSVPYHNPYMTAERMVLLDHLTRGRVMLGVGPGSLPTDAVMIGLEPEMLRDRLEEGMDAIMALLADEAPVTRKTDWFTLDKARLHLRPYTHPRFEVAVAAVASPSGPRVAGRYGVGLLSIGATMSAGFDALALHWDVMEERAAEFGQVVDRRTWRLVGPMHVAETRAEAERDVAHGIVDWFRYFQQVAAFPQMAVEGNERDEMIQWIREGGFGVIGTPDDAVQQIQRLVDQSKGFGCFLFLGNDWANPEATRRSYDLIARYVMPQFQGSAVSTLRARDYARSVRPELAAKNLRAVENMTQKHAAERARKRG
jgi:limonene 1,2-monooxygenase